MSLWVRSQDKKTFVKLDMVELLNYENSIVAYTSIKVVDLGKYSTQEKAMKVLNMMEKHINNGGRVFCVDQVKTGIGYCATFEKVLNVFQMPQDDEVEE